MVYQIFESLISTLKEKQEIYLKTISSGSFDKFEEYKFFAGRLKGFEEATSIVTEMSKRLFEDQNSVAGDINGSRKNEFY